MGLLGLVKNGAKTLTGTPNRVAKAATTTPLHALKTAAGMGMGGGGASGGKLWDQVAAAFPDAFPPPPPAVPPGLPEAPSGGMRRSPGPMPMAQPEVPLPGTQPFKKAASIFDNIGDYARVRQ